MHAKQTYIVYTIIVGSTMLAALLEWALWLVSFLYWLCKVYSRAEHWSTKALAVIIGSAFMILRYVPRSGPKVDVGERREPNFTGIRCIFLPIMAVTLPLPRSIAVLWPGYLLHLLQWVAFWAFAALLSIPWLFGAYQTASYERGRSRHMKVLNNDGSAPKIVVIMPCDREKPATLAKAVNSVAESDYPSPCLHLFLLFDGEEEDEAYLSILEQFGIPSTVYPHPHYIDVTYRAMRITVSRLPHGGKRRCQMQTFTLIDKLYREYHRHNDDMFILLVDSDCVLERACLQNFIYDMELSPGNTKGMLAMTGVIMSSTRKSSPVTLLQDMEYIHGQLFERSIESGCGAVTCLPGPLTILRFSAFKKMAKHYFADRAQLCEDLFGFVKYHLGEDRWLTHLYMIGAQKKYQIQMCPSAFCKTEAVQTYRALVKQRRRWFLGFITNEACMLTDWRLWKKYPLLVILRFMQNTIRTTALLFLVMVLGMVTTSVQASNLPVGFLVLSLALNSLLRCKVEEVQDMAVSSDVCSEPSLGLVLHCLRYIHFLGSAAG